MQHNTLLCAIFALLLSVILVLVASDSDITQTPVKIHVCCSSLFSFVDGKCSDKDIAENAKNGLLDTDSRLRYFVPHGWNSSEEMELTFETSLPECARENRNTQVKRLRVKKIINDEGEIKQIEHEHHLYSPTDYCINGINETDGFLEFELVICDNDGLCSSSSTGGAAKSSVGCLPKCCEPHQLLQSTDFEFKCVSVDSNFTWSPILHHESHPHEQLNASEQNGTELHFIHAHPSKWCKTDGFFMYQRDFPMNPKVPFHILKNGGIHYLNEGTNEWEHLPTGSYCIDGIYDEELLLNHSAGNGSLEDNNVIYYCPPESSEVLAELEEADRNNRIYILYYVVLLISSAFLLLTIIVHAVSLDKQNIHGRTLLCCFVSLFCLYIFLALLHVTRLYLDKDPTSTFCWAVAVGLHFFFLSTFSWLSVVNFDLWFTFRTLRTLISPKSHRLKRFVIYSIFAVGTPVTILAIALTIDFVQTNDDSFSQIKLIAPRYGQDGCFLSTNEANFLYLYGPIGILLIMNILLFVLTITAMYKLKQTSSMATSTSNNANHPRQSFHLFLKLFVLMGVSWIFEVISWVAHPKTIPWYWIIFDLINICQGIFIFFIFTCKKSTVRVLEQKYPRFKGLADTFRLYSASLKCAKSCPSGTSSANNTVHEMNLRKLSDTVETDIGVAASTAT